MSEITTPLNNAIRTEKPSNSRVFGQNETKVGHHHVFLVTMGSSWDKHDNTHLHENVFPVFCDSVQEAIEAIQLSDIPGRIVGVERAYWNAIDYAALKNAENK